MAFVSGCLLAAALPLPGALALAQGEAPWKVENKLVGKPKDADGRETKKAEDVSGIACETTSGFPRICLLVDDETQGAQIVILQNGKLIAGEFIRLIHHIHDGEAIELDGEAVAYADGSFYVVGSHGRARHEKDNAKQEVKNNAKAAASRHVVRVRFDPRTVQQDGKLGAAADVQVTSALSALIQREPTLARAFDVALDDNGLTIEGAAIRNGRFYAGMRGPVLDAREAAVLSIAVDAMIGSAGSAPQLHRLDLGKDTSGKARGVRDLVAFEGGFLIIAGPLNDPPGGEIKRADYSIFWWDGTSHKKLGDLNGYGSKVKPEALVPLEPTADKLRVLLFFDGPDEGEPRAVEIPRP
jgi:hypothetical protein